MRAIATARSTARRRRDRRRRRDLRRRRVRTLAGLGIAGVDGTRVAVIAVLGERAATSLRGAFSSLADLAAAARLVFLDVAVDALAGLAIATVGRARVVVIADLGDVQATGRLVALVVRTGVAVVALVGLLFTGGM